MSKGQNNHARQPVSRVKGQETAQPRNPTGTGKPGGSSFIKSKPARAPAGHGKQPFHQDRQDKAPSFGRSGHGSSRNAPSWQDQRQDEFETQDRQPYDNRQPADFTVVDQPANATRRRDPRKPGQGQPSARQGQPAGRQGPSFGRQEQSTGRQGQPSGRQEQSVGRSGQPAGRQGQSFDRQDQAAGRSGQPTGRQGQSSARQGQSSSRQDQSAGRQGQPSARQGQSYDRQEPSAGRQAQPAARQGQSSSRQDQSAGRQGQPYGRQDQTQPGARAAHRPRPQGDQAPFERQQPVGRSAPAGREGVAQNGSKPFERRASSARPGQAPVGGYTRASQTRPGVKVPRAKKLAVRDPGLAVMDKAKRLRENRVDYSRIDPVRLQKALAQSGVGSRREMEEWIEAGLVLVNGKKATLGDKVGPHDRVVVKGDSIKLKWADRLPRVILYHKQEGEIVTRDDPQGRVTIFERLPQAKSSRWVTVGRLDVNTSGLLIITTSGELANHLMHPSFEVEREYAVRVLGELTDDQRREMCQDIELEDGPARFERIIDQGGEGANHWYRVVIREGRNREVRRLFEHFELQVSRLMRVRFGNIALPPRLKRGQFYELNEVEVAAVMKWSNLTFTGSER